MKKEDQKKLILIIDQHDHDRLKERSEKDDLTIQQEIRRAIKNYLQYKDRLDQKEIKAQEEKISEAEWNKLCDEIEGAQS